MIPDFLRHFGLTTMPFSRAVPKDGILLHKSFIEAKARLLLAFELRSPALLCTEAGLGKSTLLGDLADGLDKSTTRITHTQLCACGPFGLINQLAERYGMRPRRTTAQTARAILNELAASSKHEILILDDAHRLPNESLDELRLLSNLDFDRSAPFSLLLVGLPLLRRRLDEPENHSLNQRIGLRASLSPLSDRDNAAYLDRRLRAVGATTSLFHPDAIDKVFERACGVPRQINNLANSALLAAFAAGKKHVDAEHIESAIFDHENF